MITDYLTYDWSVCICNFLFCTLYDETFLISLSLVDSITVASQSSTPYLQSIWCCPDCNETFVFSLADRLNHQSTCKMMSKKSSHG